MIHKFKITGEIGWDVMPHMIEEELNIANGKDIEVTLSSEGGSIFKGVDIFNAFREYKKDHPEAQMILNMGSVVASMGSYIAANEVFDIITVYDNTSWMIHNPLMAAIGDYLDMEKAAEFLRNLAALMSISYAQRSGKSNKEIRSMMDKEVWLFGEEIIDAGFADELMKTENDIDKESGLAAANIKFKTVMKKVMSEEIEKDEFEKVAAIVRNTPDMTVGTYDSSIDIIEQDWSQSAADKRWRAHTDAEETPNSRYAKAFLWYDGDNPDLFGSYKLQVKDYTGGREVVNIRAVNNASARLGQTQGPTSAEKTRIQGIIDKYQARWKKEQDNNSLQPAGKGGNNIIKEGRTMANTSTELRTENPALYDEVVKVGIDQAKADVIANNKAIMEFKNKDEYKNLSFVQARCEKALEDGESITDLKMSIQALMLDPKNQAEIESPGDINTGGADSISGESSNDTEDEGF